MAFIKNNLIIVLVFAACIVGLVVYQNYFDSPPTQVLTSDATLIDSNELLSSLSDLKAVTLDGGIFADPIFLSLVDFGVEIPLQPVGRPNPFAPLIGTHTGSTIVPVTTVTSKSGSGPATKKNP